MIHRHPASQAGKHLQRIVVVRDGWFLPSLPRAKTKAKKTPLGERGIRVIVVVANSVSVSAYGLWWIIIILVTDFLIIIVYSFSSWSVIFWLRCL